jgi:hypothetical protein
VDNSNISKPYLGQTRPAYPVHLQLLRVTETTVPGPTGGSSAGGTPADNLYVAYTQQSRSPQVYPRDREPCLVEDANQVGLSAGYYLGRLCNAYGGLPVYAVAAGGAGVVFLEILGPSEDANGLWPAQVATFSPATLVWTISPTVVLALPPNDETPIIGGIYLAVPDGKLPNATINGVAYTGQSLYVLQECLGTLNTVKSVNPGTGDSTITITNPTIIEIDLASGMYLFNDSGRAEIGAQAASGTHYGVVSTAVQDFAGDKTFLSGTIYIGLHYSDGQFYLRAFEGQFSHGNSMEMGGPNLPRWTLQGYLSYQLTSNGAGFTISDLGTLSSPGGSLPLGDVAYAINNRGPSVGQYGLSQGLQIGTYGVGSVVSVAGGIVVYLDAGPSGTFP